jgi:hypothetical protein
MELRVIKNTNDPKDAFQAHHSKTQDGHCFMDHIITSARF